MRDAYFDYDTRSIINLIPPGEFHPGWTISRVSVLPPNRGRGLARALMARVLADADAEGAVLFLDVQPDASGTGLTFDQLYAWYARCGFEPSRLGYPSMVRVPSIMGQSPDVVKQVAERLING